MVAVDGGWLGGRASNSPDLCRNHYCIVPCHIANNGRGRRGTCVINDDDMLLTFVSPVPQQPPCGT